MNRVIHILAALAALVLSVAAPCAASASTISKTTEEWSTSVTVSRGQEHTFWITGLTPDTDIYWMDVEATYTDADGDEAWLSVFESADEVDEEGNITGMFMLLTAEDWEDVTKSSLKFTVTVYGSYDEDKSAADRSFTFGHAAGRDRFPTEPEPEIVYPAGYDEGHARKVALKADFMTDEIPPAPTNKNRSLVTTTADASGNEWFAMENGYFFSLGTLKVGQRYMFGLEADRVTWVYTNDANVRVTNSAPVKMALYRTVDRTTNLFATADPYTNEWSGCSTAYAVEPTESGNYFICVDTPDSVLARSYVPTNEFDRLVEGPTDLPYSFTLVHAGVKPRTPEEHKPAPIATGVSAPFYPGYLTNPTNGYFDGVIDEQLFKFTDFVKGGSYIFRTEGADTNLLMRLYDKNGTILSENRCSALTSAGTNLNPQVAWTATWAGAANNAVYVGVCQDLAKGAKKSEMLSPVTLVIERVTPVDVPVAIAAVPADPDCDPRTAAQVRPSEVRKLGKDEWTNTFTLPVRKGYEYSLKAMSVDPSVTNYMYLSVEVYTLSGTTRKVLESDGRLDPALDDDNFRFAATADGTVYIEISVDRGPWGAGMGLDYAPYRLCAIMAANALESVGFLQVDMKGAPQADMGWMLRSNKKTEGTVYAAGAALAIPAGTYDLVAKKVNGFAAPDGNGFTNIVVRPWYDCPVTNIVAGYTKIDGDVTNIVEDVTNIVYAVTGTVNRAIYKYTDTSDPGDDFTQGNYTDASGKKKNYAPVSISPKADFTPLARTLWDNDVADNFKFTADANAFYKFILENNTDTNLCPGSACFTITNAEFHTDIADLTNLTYAAQRRFAKSSKPYILTAHHLSGHEQDANYELKAIAYSPASITPSTSAAGAKLTKQKLNYGEKYFKAKLTAGNAYRFAVTDLVEQVSCIRVFAPAGEEPRFGTAGFVRLPARGDIVGPAYIGTAKEFSIYPNVTGDYVFGVQGGDETVKTGSDTFTFVAWVKAQRAMSAHASTQIASFFRDGVADLQRDIGGVTLEPGYVNNPAKNPKGENDGIVDDALVKLPVPAKKIYLVETEDAQTNLVLYVYNSSGTLLQKNYSSDGTDFNVRALLEPGNSSVTYFIGVAQRMVDETKEKPAYLPVRLMVREVVQEDDIKMLKPIPANGVEDDPLVLDPDGCWGVEFASNRWTQTFSFAARKGLSYRFTTETNGADFASPYRLKASVYTLSGTKKTYLAAPAVQQDLTPGASGLEVYPTANAMHFIEIEVAEGRALDYPAITVHSTVAANETLGVVQVDMKGVEGADAEKMKWKLLTSYVKNTKTGKMEKKSMSGEPWYDNHAWLALPTNTYDFGAQTVANYAPPPKNGFTNDVAVAAYADEDDVAKLVYKYTDKYDPLDDSPDSSAIEPTTQKKYAPTTLSPSATKPATVSHSLWIEDTNDWYVITGAADTFYRIELVGESDESFLDNPAVSVFGPADKWGAGLPQVDYVKITADDWTNRTAAVQFKGEKGKKYFVKIFHGDENGNETAAAKRKDCSYLLTASVFTPGQIKLSKTEYVVKEDTAYVDVGVSRTGKYGSVRVEYWTEEGSAKPGTEYYPVHGTNVWFSGDQKEQKIRVNLIPDLVPLWANTNKDFRVRFRTFDETERIYADEFIPTFTTDKSGKVLDTVTIKMTETAKKTPGTIQVFDDGFDYHWRSQFERPVNVKKPVYNVTAGYPVEISLERTVGTNGLVGVIVSTVKGTANKNGETDYESISNFTNRWDDNVSDVCPETIVIKTKQTPEDFTTKKTFTVKLTAIKTNTKKDKSGKRIDPLDWDNPTLAASTITVNILNDKYEQSTPDWAKTKTFPPGITGVKEGKSGTWFGTEDSDNSDLYSTITRKFAGPARLRWWNDVLPDVDVYDDETNELYITSKGVTMTMRTEDKYDYDVLTATTPAAPTVNNAVVAGGNVKLSFNHLEKEVSRGISNRVYLLSKGAFYYDEKDRKVNYKLGDPETEVEPDENGDYISSVEYNDTNKGSYTWRVDSFYIGGSVTNVSKTVNLKVLDERTVPAAPAIAIEGVTKEGVPMVLDRGLYVSRTIMTTNDAAAAFVKVSGSLPKGLSIAQDTCCGRSSWLLSGTPTQAGDFEYVFQVTYGSAKVKPTTPTYVLAIHVNDFSAATPCSPTVDKVVLTPGKHALTFDVENGLSSRVFFAEKAGDLGKEGTEVFLDGENEYTVTVEDGKKYFWQVYTYYDGAVGAMNTATNKSAQFTLSGTTAGDEKKFGSQHYKTLLLGVDAYEEMVAFSENSDGSPECTANLRQRLPASFQVANYIDNADIAISGVKVVTGKLPDGLKLEQDKTDKQWYVRGTPTKAGVFQALVQATFEEVLERDPAGKAKKTLKVPASTAVVDIEVEEVEALSDISFTLTGPGRFVYKATDIRYPERIGQFHTVTNWIKAGNQTLKLSDLKHIYEYKYVQLPVVTMLPYLVDKAVVANHSDAEFKFSEYDHSLTNEGVAFRVFALSDGASWTNESNKVTKYKLGDAATEIQPNPKGQYITNVTYQAKINKGKWTFRVDSYFPGGTVTNAPKSAWSFTVSDKEAAYLPKTWVGGDDVKDVLGYTVNGSARGGQCGQGEYGKIYLRRLVKVDIPVGEEGSTVSKVTGNLPAGVSLKQVEVRKEGKTSIKRWFLTGTPTKAGEYPLVLQEKASNIPGTTTAFTLVVADAGTAEGTFNGLVFTNYANEFESFGSGVSFSAEDGVGGTTNRLQMIGQVQITAASNGKLSGKLTVAGKSYSFTDTGYTSISYLGTAEKPEDDPTGPFEYTGVMTYIQKMTEKDANNKNVSVPYTNVMSYTFIDLPKTTNLVWQGSNSVGTVLVKMAALPDLKGSGAQKKVGYLGEIGRDNSAIKEWTAEAAKCAGYYTVALAPDNDSVDADRPHGNGYLTMTVDAKGKAKFAGQLANGTAYSASAVVSTIYEDADGTRLLRFPLYAYKSPTVFGGWLTVAFPTDAAPEKNIAETADEDIPVVVCRKRGLFTDQLALNNDDPLVTCGGTNGYDLVINPVGGWYDTVINLQRYYRSGDYTNYAFSIDTAYEGNEGDPMNDDFIDLRERMKEITNLTGTNYEFVAAASANGMSVDLTGNTLSVAKQSLAKDWSKKYNDWSNSVNAANVSVKFTRATGILTGTCDLWYQGYKRDGKGNLTFEQLKYGGCKHAGVLLMSRGDDPATPLIDNDIWTAGSVIVPQKVNYEVKSGNKTTKKTRTWNASFRFNILALPVENPRE